MAFGSIYFLTSIIIIDRYCLRPDRPLSISRSCDGNLLSRSRSVGEEVGRLEKSTITRRETHPYSIRDPPIYTDNRR